MVTELLCPPRLTISADFRFGWWRGDLNGDGRVDLVVTCHTGFARNIAVILNSGSGFLPSQFYDDGSTGPTPIVLADFDGDGILDLVVGDGSLISFLKGNGDGSFGLPQTSSPRCQRPVARGGGLQWRRSSRRRGCRRIYGWNPTVGKWRWQFSISVIHSR